MKHNTQPLPIVSEETYRVSFETNDGENTTLFLGSKKEAKEHFKKMDTLKEPLKVLKIEKV